MKRKEFFQQHSQLIFFFAIVAAIGTIWILKSDGFYYIDECAHYMYCRFILQGLPTTVQMWHRPLPQWLFALPAQFGHTFTMMFAFALYLGLLFLSWRIALLHRIKHAEWIVLFVGLQPTLFDLSYACMTEVPAAWMIALSYFYHLRNRHALALTFASLVFLCRTEMYLFAGIMFLMYAWKREWKILPLVVAGPVLWIASSTIISGSITTFFIEWHKFSSIGKFIPGVSVAHYFTHVHDIFGLAQVLLAAAGVFMIAQANRTKEYIVIYCAVLATMILHTLAGAEVFHFSASIGELRYIAVIGPLFGILAADGFSELLERTKSPAARLLFSLIVVCVVVFHCTTATHPRQWANYEKIIVRLADEIKTDYPHRMILTNHSAAAYELDALPTPQSQIIAPINAAMLQQHPECVILWDPFSANSIFFQTAMTKEMMLQDPTIHIVDRYIYWNAEYLLLYKTPPRNIPG